LREKADTALVQEEKLRDEQEERGRGRWIEEVWDVLVKE